jgi:hypothetical protein
MKTLKDIANNIDPRYGTGTLKVWYMKKSFWSIGSMGTWGIERAGKPLPTPETLEQTHTCVGTLDVDDLGEAWGMMQGESWSPRGEARELIVGLGLVHTSMSVGDIFQKDGVLFMVEGVGFKRIP